MTTNHASDSASLSCGFSYNSARFLQSASKLSNCPPDDSVEIAFAGRSNAGKSSAINAITNNKKLARTSKTPGRTQLINFFSLNHPQVRLVDLPGYGYAKVPLSLKADWGTHLDDYLRNRSSLCGLVLIMDIRRPLTEFDQMLLKWTSESNLPIIILLTKADKFKYGAAKQVYLELKRQLADHPTLRDIILFSSVNKSGTQESQSALSLLIQSKLKDLAQSPQSNTPTATE